MQTNNAALIVEALSLLELVLHHSASNFHAKLLLVKLYHLLGESDVRVSGAGPRSNARLPPAGNALAADTVYQRLEVKHIQLVSLGWLHAARLAPACACSRALQLLADTRSFHSHHAKDVSMGAGRGARRRRPGSAPPRRSPARVFAERGAPDVRLQVRHVRAAGGAGGVGRARGGVRLERGGGPRAGAAGAAGGPGAAAARAAAPAPRAHVSTDTLLVTHSVSVECLSGRRLCSPRLLRTFTCSSRTADRRKLY